MKWLRRAKVTWKRAVRPRRPASVSSGNGISRRIFLQRTAALTALAAAEITLQSCAVVMPREHGYGKEFNTRRPDSSVRKVVESFPHAGEMEVGFIKERKAGELVGASVTREKDRTVIAYNSFTRDPRSLLHTHPVNPNQDVRAQTYPSPSDFHWIIDRIEGKSEHPTTMRTIHIMPMMQDGRALGFSTIYLGKKWLQVEKENPKLIRAAWQYYFRIGQARSVGAIPIEEYIKRMNDFFKEMKDAGLKVRVTPYPGFKVENGFLVPKGE